MYSPRPRRRTTALAVAAAAALVLAGCSGGTSGTGATGSSDALTTFTPAGSGSGSGSVDRITWNVFQGEPRTIDPFQSADYTPNTINSNMCETLLAQTPDFRIKPNLATSYSNPDPTTWVYKLRGDVTYGPPTAGIDGLCAKAIGTKDESARSKLVVRMEQKLHEEMDPMFSGIRLTNDVWLGSRITGAPAAFDYVYYPWAAHLGGTGK
ncbi:hypothetical protein ACIQ9J_25355 [Streptomyces sp. NPDC094153]|uniref:hypothetical protein n=1 Tax=Streptomyces sp. NPDC094153 TaxID=3366058 RepID=UPI0037FB8845